jgi:hypothetical protein
MARSRQFINQIGGLQPPSFFLQYYPVPPAQGNIITSTWYLKKKKKLVGLYLRQKILDYFFLGELCPLRGGFASLRAALCVKILVCS